MMLWLNGALLATGEARIDPGDRGFALGDGVFETIRAGEGVPLHLARHLARLRAGLALLDIPLALSDAELADAMARVLAANGLANAALRLTVSRGVAARGVLPTGPVSPTILITAGPPPPVLPPARMIIAEGTRRNKSSPLSRIKSLNYLDSILARQEAARRGADDALLLNAQGFIVEATAANLFLWRDGALVTPPVRDGALPGIARGLILERAGAEERSLRPEDSARAEAAVLSNSLGLRPVAAIGDALLPLRPDLLVRLAAAVA